MENAETKKTEVKYEIVDREAINRLEPIEFAGPIVVVDSDETYSYALSRINTSKIIGFDTESRPAFIKGQKFPVSIIQIALTEEAFIFKLSDIGFRQELVDIFSSRSVLKVGIGVHDDIRRLRSLYDFEPEAFIDLADVAKKRGLVHCGARALTAIYLGKKLIKSSQKTNWAKKTLTERQLRYAATDAWICLLLLSSIDNDEFKIELGIRAE